MAVQLLNVFTKLGIGVEALRSITSTSLRKRAIATTAKRGQLEEFFDEKKNYGEPVVKSGRPWRMDELRMKSNSDLHKLWFVLYKERNMLYTMQEACRAESEAFPSPERIDKVEESMSNLENVVRERNKAYWTLEVSACATGERPSVFRRDVLGRPRWHKASQHIVPYRSNWKFRNSQGPGRFDETSTFFSKYREMKRKHYNYARSKTAREIRDMFRRFPDADVDYVAECHPEFPPGYVRHLRDNLHLYDDPPRTLTRLSLSSIGKMLSRNDNQRLLA